jgi:hypothetical protein
VNFRGPRLGWLRNFATRRCNRRAKAEWHSQASRWIIGSRATTSGRHGPLAEGIQMGLFSGWFGGDKDRKSDERKEDPRTAAANRRYEERQEREFHRECIEGDDERRFGNRPENR